MTEANFFETASDHWNLKLEMAAGDWKTRFKRKMFWFFATLFDTQGSSTMRLKNQYILQSLSSIIMTIQSVCLVYHAQMPIDNWDTHRFFWDIIRHLSFDNICESTHIATFCFYGIITSFQFMVVGILSIMILSFLGRSLYSIFLTILKKFLVLYSTILFIPSLKYLMQAVNNYDEKNTALFEDYSVLGSISDIKFQLTGTILTFLWLIFLIIVGVCKEIFSAQINHISCHRNILARSQSTLDIKQVFFYIIFTALNVFVGRSSKYAYAQVIIGFISLYCLIENLSFVSYYDRTMNTLQASRHLVILFTSVAFLIGEAVDDAGLILLLFLVCVPLQLYLFIIWVNKNYDNWLIKNKLDSTNQHQFEKSIRHHLCKQQSKDGLMVLDLFLKKKKNKRFLYNNLLILWEVNYCLDALKDERLARIKITQLDPIKSSLECEYQEWILMTRLENSQNKDLHEINYLVYFRKLETAKAIDEDVCQLMINMWTEIAKEKADFSKVLNNIVNLSEKIQKVKVLYTNLTKHNKHSAIFIMYSSFLSSVLNKQKQAALIKSRAIGIDSSRTVSDENYQLGMFLDKTATLLISAGAKNFGIIVHANEEASAILKVPLNDLTGMSLNSFIPTPINLYHENYMKDFASTMIDPEVIKGKNLYFQDNSGRLIGVSLKVRLTALDKQLLYIANFHKKNAERDICLTAEDGTVYNYTELFPYCLGISQSNIVNQSIYDYLPELLSQEMTPSMFITTKNFKEIAILQKIILMNKTPIRLISVMQDTSVVKKIKSKLDLDDWTSNASDSKSELIVKRKNETVKFKMNSVAPFKIVKSTNFEIYSENQVFDETTIGDPNSGTQPHESLTSSLSSRQKTNKRLINNHIVTFRKRVLIFKWTLLFSIIFIITANITILAYISGIVNHTSSIKVFSNFGNLMFHTSSLGDRARTVYNNFAFNTYNYIQDLQSLNYTISEVDWYQSQLLADLNDWEYCPTSKIVTESIIPVWKFDVEEKIEHSNLKDISKLMVTHATAIVSAVQKNETFEPHIKYILANSLGMNFEYIKDALKELVDCEIDRVKLNGEIIWILFISQIIITAGFVVLLVFYVFLISKDYDQYWKFIKRICISSYFGVKANMKERLLHVHGLELANEDSADKIYPASLIKSNIVLNYSARLSVLLILSFVYVFLAEFVIYDKCESLMIYRPQAFQSLLLRKSALSNLSLYARDANFPLNTALIPNQLLENSRENFNVSAALFIKETFNLRKEGYLSLMKQELIDHLYEKTNSTEVLMKYGTFGACNVCHLDSINIAARTGRRPGDERKEYIKNVYSLQDQIQIDFELFDSGSDGILIAQLDLFWYLTISYSIGILILYFIFYLPFLYKQSKMLNDQKILASIIPFSL